MSPSKDRSRAIMIALLSSAIGLLVWFSVSSMNQAAKRANAATQNRVEAETLSRDIRRLSNQSRVASLAAESASRITRRITDAAQEAGVRLGMVTSLDPQSPSRLGRSDYEMRTTAIVVQDVTLPQLAVFCETLSDAQNGLTVRDLTLDSRMATASAGDGESWDVRMALTQLIFSPISQP